MASGLVAPSGSSTGSQRPRIESFPSYATSAGDEVVRLARLAGIELDPWQQRELTHGLGESPDWKCPRCTHRAAAPEPCPTHPFEALIHPWAAFEVTEVVPRQNGKSELLIARMLGGLFVLEEPLQIYSAHLFDTSMEVMRRLVFVIENTDELRGEVKRRGSRLSGIKYSHGEEGIELQNGLRVRFKARTGGGGRGFSCDCLYLDEAMILPESFLGATVPTLSARANPQIWLAGSAPDQHEPTHDGIVLAKRRERAIAGDDPSLAYFEHSAEGDSPDTVDRGVLDDPEQWAIANPGLGIRITTEYVANERRAMGDRQFAVERLGIGDWPSTDGAGDGIDPERWDSLQDRGSQIADGLFLAIDTPPDRSSTTIGTAGRNGAGDLHVEYADKRPGTGWVVDRVDDLVQKHTVLGIKVDGRGAAASLIPELEQRSLPVEIDVVSAGEHAQACGALFDAVTDGELRHLGQPALDAAVRGAMKRKLGEAWAWDRKNSSVDISPLVSCTLAAWGVIEAGETGGGFEW